MIYLLGGNDSPRRNLKVGEIAAKFVEVAGGNEAVTRIFVPDHSLDSLRALLETGSLFRKKRLVVLEDVFSVDTEIAAFLVENASLLEEGEDIFILEGRIRDTEGEELYAKLKKHATKSQEFKEVPPRATPKAPSSGINVFAFTDAIGARRRLDALIIFHRLLRDGETAEKIFWTLLWHIKSLATIHALRSAGEDAATIARKAKMHPFVVKKGLAQAANFSLAELSHIYEQLSDLDLQIKQSRGDSVLGLERIVLAL